MQESWSDLIKPKGLEIEEKSLTSSYGRFISEPFERGFGTTLGNALRRVLLSSLSGAAITKVRIQGVLHEFSTVPGVTEDVTDLLLNLKEVRFRLRGSDSETARLEVRGERAVTARDLVVGAHVDILNPDAHIATLGKGMKLELEAFIRRGRGYVPAEQHKSEEDPIGMIPVDTVFSPVRKVNFNVSNARVKQRTDYERLSLEIWTDGSVRPDDALTSAARILQEQLAIFIGSMEEGEVVRELPQEPTTKLDEDLYRPIEELSLSVRSVNCLQSADIRYVGELVQKNESDLLKTKNFGRKSLTEIHDTLRNMGLELGMQLQNFPAREELERRRAAREKELV